MRIRELIENLVVAPSKITGAGRGLFAASPISAGKIILLTDIEPISPNDWEKIKNTRFRRKMGLTWQGGEHVFFPGPFRYRLDPDDVRAFASTDRWKDDVSVSGFSMANHSDQPNSEAIIDIPGRRVGLRALRFIDADEEILKRYEGVSPKAPKSLDFSNI